MVTPRTNARSGRLIYIAGCDGTGKSTQAALLLAALRERGVRAQHLWLRFPFLFSLPLLVYARARGLSWSEETGGVRHGYWNFARSPLLRGLLPWTLLLDAALAALGKLYLPLALGQTVVCERFAIDMLADLAVAFDDDALPRRLPGRLFRRLIPRGACVAVLDLDAETIRARRADLVCDKKLEVRLAAFRQIAQDFQLATISSQQSVDVVQRQIWERAGEPAAPAKGYAKVGNGVLQRLMRHAPVAVLSHWAFQSIFYMDATERRFKIGVELVLWGTCALLLGVWLPAGFALVGGLIAAHTLNFLFNGHLWGLLKHYGLVSTHAADFDAYVRALRARARREPSLERLVMFGSLSRAAWSPSSDLDARVVRRAGFGNGLRACWFVLRERARALVRGFPLDLYVFDSPRSLARMSRGEPMRDLL